MDKGKLMKVCKSVRKIQNELDKIRYECYTDYYSHETKPIHSNSEVFEEINKISTATENIRHFLGRI